MKKSDIRNGMHVITNDGTEYVIIGGVEAKEQRETANTIMVQFNGNGWMPFDDYDDDLRYHNHKGDDDYNDDRYYDIKAVYAPLYYSWVLSSVHHKTFTNTFTKVWERPITKKMTKAEIEKELGYEIEIVED